MLPGFEARNAPDMLCSPNAATALSVRAGPTTSLSVRARARSASAVFPNSGAGSFQHLRAAPPARERVQGAHDIVTNRGYLRCTLVGNWRWEKKWSRDADQPENGFTVLATEPEEHVELLCDEYLHADRERRKLIRLLAQTSVESAQDTLEPV